MADVIMFSKPKPAPGQSECNARMSRMIGAPNGPLENIMVRCYRGNEWRVYRTQICSSGTRFIWRLWDTVDNPKLPTMRMVTSVTEVTKAQLIELIDESALSDEQIALCTALILKGVIK